MGIPTKNQAIYGFKKDPDKKHYWLIDEEAAAVVRRIYQLALNGKGAGQIASILRDEQIECPSVYLVRKGIRSSHFAADMSRPYDWSATSVATILTRPEYKGNTVYFRFRKESYKMKKFKEAPKEEWKILENTHEAIIDPATWELAQQTRHTVHRTDHTGEANPLTGLVFCADCGAKMYNHRQKKNGRKNESPHPKTGLFPNDCYECSTYSLSSTHTDRNCFSHYISTRALNALVLETIRLTSRYAIENQAEFIKKVREAAKIKQSTAAKDLKKQIVKAKKRSAELDGLIKKLYESYATGKITESRFDMLIADYEREQAQINELIGTEEEQLTVYAEDTERIEDFLALARKYTDFTELTPQMIYEFIDKIVVHKGERIDDERTQEVEIFLKYIGKFDVPLPDPTPEEIAAQEKKKRQRAMHREYARKSRARKKAETEAARLQAEASEKQDKA